jgi:transcriptional regulator with XRE-family HTH domain
MTEHNRQQTRDRIGLRVARLRKLHDLSQEELAGRAGLQRSHIARIESGKYAVTFETIQAIADAFGMTVDIIDRRLEGLVRIED